MVDRDCRCFHRGVGVDRSVLQHETRVLHASTDSAGVLCDRATGHGFCDLCKAYASAECVGQAVLRPADHDHASEDSERGGVRHRMCPGGSADTGDLRELLRLERLLRRHRDDAVDERQGGEGGREARGSERGIEVSSAGRADEREVWKVDRQGPRRRRCEEVKWLLSCRGCYQTCDGCDQNWDAGLAWSHSHGVLLVGSRQGVPQVTKIDWYI